MSIEGRSYTSNVAKLLKHLPKLQGLQQGRVSPVMVHIAVANPCNLTCEYCCYGNRELKERLTLDHVISALDQFREIDTLGAEFTGGGEPTIWPHLNQAVEHAKAIGYDVGLVTNGVNFKLFQRFDLLTWVRLSLHGLNHGIDLGPAVETIRAAGPAPDISSVYIWTKGSEEVFPKVVEFTDRWQIPTRVTPDLTLGTASIEQMMAHVGGFVRQAESDGRPHQIFLSDFNVQTTRAHHRCYMWMVKPFVFPDGNVYVCPCAALSPENNVDVNEQFKVCAIEDIRATYAAGVKTRIHDCTFCKFAGQNELVDEVLRKTKHNSFA